MAKRKFNFKNLGKDAGKDATKLALVTAGVIGSKKFLSFDQLLSNQPPDSAVRKNEGWIKAGLAVLAMPMVKNDMGKALLMGIGLEGLITAIRRMTVNQQTQQAYFPAIGAQQPTSVIRQLDAGVGKNLDPRGYSRGVNRRLQPRGYQPGMGAQQPFTVAQQLDSGVGGPANMPGGNPGSAAGQGIEMGVLLHGIT